MLTKFSEIFGNSVTKRLLQSRARSKNLPHVLLFSGPSGVGKSSTARIVALTLDCVSPGDDGPCLSCARCSQNIVNDKLVNNSHIHVVDCPKVTSLDEINKYCNIIEHASETGIHIYIFEEIHAWSKIENAYTTLLQHLDNPPESVYVIMCTTKESALPVTLRYRATRFRFNDLDNAEMFEMYKDLAYKNFMSNPANSELALFAKTCADDGKGQFSSACIKAANGNPRRLARIMDFAFQCDASDYGDWLRYIQPVTDSDLASLLAFAIEDNAQNFINQYNMILGTISTNELIAQLKDFTLRLNFYAKDNTLGNFDDDTKDAIRHGNLLSRADDIYKVVSGLYSSMSKEDLVFKLYELKFMLSGKNADSLAPRSKAIAMNERSTIRNGGDKPSYIPGMNKALSDLSIFDSNK